LNYLIETPEFVQIARGPSPAGEFAPWGIEAVSEARSASLAGKAYIKPQEAFGFFLAAAHAIVAKVALQTRHG
jgi:hypothetical protein